MRNFSVFLNVILIIAVGFLYYLHFSTTKPAGKNVRVSKSTETSIGGTNKAAIAYVDLDSLNENIIFIKTKRKELESEQKAIENEWESGYRGLENQKNNFLKRGNAITQQEAEEFQGKLIQQQQQIDGKKQDLTQRLSEKSYKFMEGIQQQLKEFLTEYNKEKNYQYIFTAGTGLDYMVYKDSTLNITEDVIAGMNERIKAQDKK
jgi:outer membrane protein